MGRKTIHDKPMSATERQRRRRKALRDADMHLMYVRGKAGYFDEKVRIALAVKRLADRKALPLDVIDQLIKESIDCLPPKNRIDRLYLEKILAEFLNFNKGEKK